MRDLTHRIRSEMPNYPGDPIPEVRPHATHETDGYRVAAVGIGTHTGTHVDAPAHVEPDGTELDAYPLDRFSGDAVLADVQHAVATEEPITQGMLEAAVRESLAVEADQPVSVDADLLVVDTGWHTHWGTDRYIEHPYLTPEAARWCVEQNVDVAIDAPSVDPLNGDLAAHHELCRADRLIYENLTALDGLPDRFSMAAFPLPVEAGDGAPVRAVALTNPDTIADGFVPDSTADRTESPSSDPAAGPAADPPVDSGAESVIDPDSRDD